MKTNPSTQTLALAAALLAVVLPGARATNAYNDFSSGLGTWTTTYGLTDNGFNLGWSDTSYAGGSAGEVGGLVTRYAAPSSPSANYLPRILDTQSFAGNPLNLNYAISVSGDLYLHDINASSDVNLGYFNTAASDPSSQRLVLRIHSPSTAGGGLWRFRFGDGNGSQSSSERVTVPSSSWDSAPLNFSFNFAPSGLNDGSGILSGKISYDGTDLSLFNRSVAANTWNFDSFGFWVDSASSTDLTKQQLIYLDNVSYTIVPEPSPTLLAGLGAGALLLVQRVSRRR